MTILQQIFQYIITKIILIKAQTELLLKTNNISLLKHHLIFNPKNQENSYLSLLNNLW